MGQRTGPWNRFVKIRIRKYKRHLKNKKKEEIFCQEYLKGKSYYFIAKEYNIEPNAIKYYLIKNNIYHYQTKEDILLKNAVVQYDKNNNLLKVHTSALKASKSLGFNSSSAISQVCSGKRKYAYGFVWKKYIDLDRNMQNKIVSNKEKYFN